MANHTIDCAVCGDDLRGSGTQRCLWSSCPGYLVGKKDLEAICGEHPDAELRERACAIRVRNCAERPAWLNEEWAKAQKRRWRSANRLCAECPWKGHGHGCECAWSAWLGCIELHEAGTGEHLATIRDGKLLWPWPSHPSGCHEAPLRAVQMRSGERWQAESPGAVANVILSNIAELAWGSGSGYDSGARVNLLETPDVIRAAVRPNYET